MLEFSKLIENDEMIKMKGPRKGMVKVGNGTLMATSAGRSGESGEERQTAQAPERPRWERAQGWGNRAAPPPGLGSGQEPSGRQGVVSSTGPAPLVLGTARSLGLHHNFHFPDQQHRVTGQLAAICSHWHTIDSDAH